MYKIQRSAFAGLAVATLLGSVTWVGIAHAGIAPPPAEKLVQGDREVLKLLRLMDKDKNGRISKQEYLTFMEAEFDRLDTDKSGELDVKEILESRIHYRSGISR